MHSDMINTLKQKDPTVHHPWYHWIKMLKEVAKGEPIFANNHRWKKWLAVIPEDMRKGNQDPGDLMYRIFTALRKTDPELVIPYDCETYEKRTCRSCLHVSDQPLLEITFTIPLIEMKKEEKQLDLQTLIDDSVRQQHPINDFPCKNCNTRTIADSKSRLSKAPELLCVQIQRTYKADNGTLRRDTHPITIPYVINVPEYGVDQKLPSNISEYLLLSQLNHIAKLAKDKDGHIIDPKATEGHYTCWQVKNKYERVVHDDDLVTTLDTRKLTSDDLRNSVYCFYKQTKTNVAPEAPPSQ